MAKQLSRMPGKNRAYTKCGTPVYSAPEVIKISPEDGKNEGYGFLADVWSWGVLLCELIGGFNPFHASDTMQIYDNIIKGKVNWPKNIDIMTKDLLLKVLIVDPNLRFGIRDIKNHKVFNVRF